MTNSLSLRQCHLPGQSSFLFSKCFSRFPQSLKDQKDTFFIPVHAITIPQFPQHSKFRSSLFALHFLTRFQYGASAASGAASTHSRVYALLLLIRMSSINAYRFWFSGSHFPLWTVFKQQEKASRIWFTGLEKIWSKYLENKRLHCFEKWHCLSDSEFVIFRSVFVSFSSLSTSRSLNRPDRSDTRRTFLHLTLSDF